MERDYPQLSFSHVYISKLASTDSVVAEYKKRSLKGQLLFDSEKIFSTLLAVKTTCENFVIDNKGTLVYRGAIDDQYGINITKEQPEKLYLKDALESLIAGKTVTYPLTGAPGCLVSTDAKTIIDSDRDVTFHKDISRIMQNKCQQCHRKGGVGPFELMTFEQAKERRKMLKYVVEKDIMPPWFAEDNRQWANNYDLSSNEKEILLQ